MSRALAANDRSAALADDEAPITALGEQLVATRQAAEERLRGLVQDALMRTMERMHDARRGMERVITFSQDLEQLAIAEQEDDDAADTAKREPKRSQRLEYVEDTNDPLAGL